MIHSHELHDSPLNHSQTQPLCYWPKLTSNSITKLQERLHFKFVLRKKSKEVPSANKPKKDQKFHARFHSWNHLFMCDAPKACSRNAKKRTAWRSYDAQKHSSRRDSQPKLTKFSLNHSSFSCLPASSPKIQDILQQNTNANGGLRADWWRTPLGHWGHNK